MHFHSKYKMVAGYDDTTTTHSSTTFTATADAAGATNGAELWKIIRNGKTFLTALEQFAKLNYPIDNNNNQLHDDDDDDDGGDDNNEDKKEEAMIHDKRTSTAKDDHSKETNYDEISSKAAAQDTTITLPSTHEKNRKRAILSYCADTGRLIGRFANLRVISNRLAASFPGLSPLSIQGGIEGVLDGSLPRYLNYYFRFADDMTTPFPNFPIGVTSTNNKRKMQSSGEHDNLDNDIDTPETKRQRLPYQNIIQYNSTTGEVEGGYDTLAHAARALANSNPTVTFNAWRAGIQRVLKGRLKPYKGCFFRYVGDTSPMPRFPMEDGNHKHGNINDDVIASQAASAQDTTSTFPSSYEKNRKRQVLQYCADTGRLIGCFENLDVIINQLAASFPGLSTETIKCGIQDMLDGNISRYLNLYFRFADDITMPMPNFPIVVTATKNENKKRCSGQRDHLHNDNDASESKRQTFTGRNIIRYNSMTGEIEGGYDTINQAARALEASNPDMTLTFDALRSRIRRILIGQLKPLKGCFFRFASDTSPMPRFPIGDETVSPGRRMVVVYCSRTGNLIGRFKSARSAARNLSKILPRLQYEPSLYFGAILSMLKQERKTASYRGLYFRSSDDESPMPAFPIPGSEKQAIQFPDNALGSTSKDSHDCNTSRCKHPSGAIEVYSAKTGQSFGIYKNVSEISRGLTHLLPENSRGLDSSYISRILKEISYALSYRGFYFRYLNDTSPMPVFPILVKAHQHIHEMNLQVERKHYKKDRELQGEDDTNVDNSNDNTQQLCTSMKAVGRKQLGAGNETQDENIKHYYPARAVAVFCAKTGKSLGTFENASEASRGLVHLLPEKTSALNISDICQILRRDSTTSYRGFYFRYLKNRSPMPIFPISSSWYQLKYGNILKKTQDGHESRLDKNDDYVKPSADMHMDEKQNDEIDSEHDAKNENNQGEEPSTVDIPNNQNSENSTEKMDEQGSAATDALGKADENDNNIPIEDKEGGEPSTVDVPINQNSENSKKIGNEQREEEPPGANDLEKCCETESNIPIEINIQKDNKHEKESILKGEEQAGGNDIDQMMTESKKYEHPTGTC